MGQQLYDFMSIRPTASAVLIAWHAEAKSLVQKGVFAWVVFSLGVGVTVAVRREAYVLWQLLRGLRKSAVGVVALKVKAAGSLSFVCLAQPPLCYCFSTR